MVKAIIEYCPMCDSNYLSDLPHDCTMIIIKPAVPAMSDEASKDVWNAAIEAAASKAVYPAFVEAHDTEWDEGYNYARKLIEVEIRTLKK